MTVGTRIQGLLGQGVWRYYLGFALGRAAGIVILPVISRLLGVAGLGTFEVGLAVLMAATIVLDAGFGASLVRFINDGKVSDRDLLGAAMALQLIASMVAIAVFAWPLVALAGDGQSIPLLLAVLVLFAFIEGYAVIGAGLLRARAHDGVFFLLSAARFVTTAAAATIGAELAGADGALLGVAVGGVGFAVYAFSQLAKGPSPGTTQTRGLLLRYGLPLMFTTVMTWSLSVSDRVVLGITATDEALGQYAASYRLGSVVLIFLAGPLALAWIPVARANPDAPERERAAARWFARFTLAALGSVVVLVAVAPEGVPFLFGAGFEADRLVVACAGVSGWLAGLFYLIATPVLTAEATRSLVLVSVLVVVVNVAANVALIPTHVGRGAAVATLISYTMLCVLTYARVRRMASIAWLTGTPQSIWAAVLLASIAVIAADVPPGAVVAVLVLGTLPVFLSAFRTRFSP